MLLAECINELPQAGISQFEVFASYSSKSVLMLSVTQ